VIWIVLVASAATLYVGMRRRRDFVDFVVYRTAAERALDAESLYRPEDGHYQYKYFPAFALAMAPFAVTEGETARVIWYTLSCGLLALYFRQSVRALPNRRLQPFTLTAIAAALLAKSIIPELVNGQTNLLLANLLFAGALFAVREQSIIAGVCVGVALFVKPYAAVFLPWLAVVGGVEAVAGLVAATLALLIAPAAVYGWHGNIALLGDWWRTVSQTTAPLLLGHENISIAAMWAKWIGIGRTASMLTLATALAIAALGVWLWLVRKRAGSPWYLESSYLLLSIPLLSPQGWDYVLLVGTPAFVVLVDRFRNMTTTFCVVVAAGFVCTSLTTFDILGRQRYNWVTDRAIVTIGAFALIAGLAHLRRRALA